MKKRIITIALAVTMVLSACGGNESEGNHSRPDRDDEEIEESEIKESEIEKVDKTDDSDSETKTPSESVEAETPSERQEFEHIFFGHYEQDGDFDNGTEPIEWDVLAEENGRMLLVSRYILNCEPYNYAVYDTDGTTLLYYGAYNYVTNDYSYNPSDGTWETSNLRGWLNERFYRNAFDEAEQEQILTVTLANPDNPIYGTEGGNDTEDRVFCLSLEEILDYYQFDKWDKDGHYGNCSSLCVEITQLAKIEDVTHNSDGFGVWWVRSPGIDSGCAIGVLYDGSTGWCDAYSPPVCSGCVGVRPAIWINSN